MLRPGRTNSFGAASNLREPSFKYTSAHLSLQNIISKLLNSNLVIQLIKYVFESMQTDANSFKSDIQFRTIHCSNNLKHGTRQRLTEIDRNC